MNNSTFHFVVESMEIENGRKLKALKPDDRGYYDLPIAVIGAPTRNNVLYDPPSFKKCLLDKDSRFNILLKERNLYGEYGHPFSESVERTLEVFEDKIAHHIKKVYTGEQLPNGGTILMAKIKPYGPYKNELKDSIEDPDMNTAFSLRAISEQQIDFKTKQITRYMKYLVTFDFVHGSGYKESTKWYSPSQEGFNSNFDPNSMKDHSFEITKENFFKSDGTIISTEHITDKDILNIFGAKEIMIKREEKLIRFNGSSTIFSLDGNKTSILHEALK